jgi:hypothetical protein
MKVKPSFAFTWGREPIDTRLGLMIGTQYDHVILSDTEAARCIRCDVSLGLLWVNVRLGVVVW